MSDVALFPRLPPLGLSPEEHLRRDSDQSKYMLGHVDTLTDRLDVLDRIAAEQILVVNPTNFTPVSFELNTYAQVLTPAACEITFDNATGYATIAHTGFYRIDAYVAWTGTGNNQFYGIDMVIDDGVTPSLITLGNVIWSNSYPAASEVAVSGSFKGDLNAGDKVAMAWDLLGNTVTTPSAGEFSVELIGVFDEVQGANMRILGHP